ncbi:hypothetical protein BJV82DRAFT_669151 [Fennellomyces sp. T-0311]|nr:hypothetical protein BJV82DRAFT_669151 [Fennellomyces sp. T-0311]
MWPHIVSSKDALNDSNAEYFIWNICSKSVDWTASTTLWFARIRTSSKAHNRIFVLAKIFPELKSDITFSYEQPMLDLMIQFYGLLAQKDLSVLCFGTPLEKPKILDCCLGQVMVVCTHHICRKNLNLHFLTSPTLRHRKIFASDLQLCPRFYQKRGRPQKITMNDDCRRNSEDGLPTHPLVVLDRDELLQIAASGPIHMTFASTAGVSQDDHNLYTQDYGLKATHFLPVKEENGAWINTISEPKELVMVVVHRGLFRMSCIVWSTVSALLLSSTDSSSGCYKRKATTTNRLVCVLLTPDLNLTLP